MKKQRNHGYEHLSVQEAQVLTSVRERYCLTQFFSKQNQQAGYKKYEVEESPIYRACSYDATLKVYNKNQELVKYFIVEVKVREEIHNDYFFEKAKKDALLKAKEEKDLLLASKGLNIECGILYINFMWNGTIIWDILDLIEEGIIKRGTRKLMNKKTIASRTEKKLKSVYSLKTHHGKFYTDFMFSNKNFLLWYEEQKQPKTKSVEKSKWSGLKSIFPED